MATVHGFMLDLDLMTPGDVPVTIALINFLGQEIYSAREFSSDGKLKKEIFMPSAAASGFYQVRVVVMDTVIEHKLMFQR